MCSLQHSATCRSLQGDSICSHPSEMRIHWSTCESWWPRPPLPDCAVKPQKDSVFYCMSYPSQCTRPSAQGGGCRPITPPGSTHQAGYLPPLVVSVHRGQGHAFAVNEESLWSCTTCPGVCCPPPVGLSRRKAGTQRQPCLRGIFPRLITAFDSCE